MKLRSFPLRYCDTHTHTSYRLEPVPLSPARWWPVFCAPARRREQGAWNSAHRLSQALCSSVQGCRHPAAPFQDTGGSLPWNLHAASQQKRERNLIGWKVGVLGWGVRWRVEGSLGGRHCEVYYFSCEGPLFDSVSRMIIPLWMNWDCWVEGAALASLCLTWH